ncbi:MAG: hypothetical protein EOP22_09000 [Hyphomicrobiales bacterium]|nr:MAG: hypothetical protein EOP22_09000 [Hyphomicrobiales bacterium]
MAVAKLLVISNGHGEDSIAAEIIRRLPKTIEAAAYPTLGDGKAYAGVCPIVGPRRHLPSEGQRRQGSLLRDAIAGFGIGPAMRFMRGEAKSYDAILVVGDLLGVVMCWWSGNRARIYLDVYKSGYANEYSNLERWLLKRTAELVLTRDPILAEQLQKARINARFAGNVMMDTIVTGPYNAQSRRRNAKAIAVLPGSRAAMKDNLALQLAALQRVPGIEGVDVFAVLARAGDTAELDGLAGARLTSGNGRDGDLGTLSDGRVAIQLTTGSLGAVIAASDIVLGQGGTANLQSLGLGKPVVSFLAEDARETRRKRIAALTGDSRIVTERTPEALAAELARLLADDADRKRRGALGRDRIGPSGAIPAIIEDLSR